VEAMTAQPGIVSLLLTTDLDFDHLHGTWIDRIWVDPRQGKTP